MTENFVAFLARFCRFLFLLFKWDVLRRPDVGRARILTCLQWEVLDTPSCFTGAPFLHELKKEGIWNTEDAFRNIVFYTSILLPLYYWSHGMTLCLMVSKREKSPPLLSKEVSNHEGR